MARLLAREGRLQEAARLFSAVDEQRKVLGVSLTSSEQEMERPARESLAAEPVKKRLAEVAAQGAKMTVEEAAAFARTSLGEL
jgi:hypothetical protein